LQNIKENRFDLNLSRLAIDKHDSLLLLAFGDEEKTQDMLLI
jgi:hypothetical protein